MKPITAVARRYRFALFWRCWWRSALSLTDSRTGDVQSNRTYMDTAPSVFLYFISNGPQNRFLDKRVANAGFATSLAGKPGAAPELLLKTATC